MGFRKAVVCPVVPQTFGREFDAIFLGSAGVRGVGLSMLKVLVSHSLCSQLLSR